MSRKNVAIPAVRLSTGEILQGEPHAVLVLRAIELGLSEGANGGHINKNGIFMPVYPTPNDVLPFKLDSKLHAIETANNASWQMRDAAQVHLDAGRDDADGLNEFINRFDSLCGIPLIPAIQNINTKEVFTGGILHSTVMAQHPELVYPPSLKHGGDFVEPFEVGWKHFDGRFFNREGAANIAKSIVGFTSNIRHLVSGEEWIPRLEDDEDAEILGEHFHTHGFRNAKIRVQLFTMTNTHIEHTRLLKRAIKLYERINKK